MNTTYTNPQSDHWSDWLLHRRHADDEAFERLLRPRLDAYADRVLDAANLIAGMTLADIGSGDGLIAFRAIERIGPSLKVLLTDISRPMLRHAELLSIQRRVREQCEFVECQADHLSNIADASVDVVTTRSVLAYVPDKVGAMREFHRVLRPGGRISIAEPVLQDEAFAACALKQRLDACATLSADRFLPLLHRWKAAQFPDTLEKVSASPIANYSERDLVRFTSAAGFKSIHMELHVDVMPSLIKSWDVFLGSSPHPLAPTLKVILAERFSTEERQFFEDTMRPVLEQSGSETTERMVYLSATKYSK